MAMLCSKTTMPYSCISNSPRLALWTRAGFYRIYLSHHSQQISILLNIYGLPWKERCIITTHFNHRKQNLWLFCRFFFFFEGWGWKIIQYFNLFMPKGCKLFWMPTIILHHIRYTNMFLLDVSVFLSGFLHLRIHKLYDCSWLLFNKINLKIIKLMYLKSEYSDQLWKNDDLRFFIVWCFYQAEIGRNSRNTWW